MDILATLANLVLPEGDEFSTLGQPVWNVDGDRVSSSGRLVLTSTGYLTKDGMRPESFQALQPVGTSGVALSDTDVLRKCSVIDALSWRYINAKPLPAKRSSGPWPLRKWSA